MAPSAAFSGAASQARPPRVSVPEQLVCHRRASIPSIKAVQGRAASHVSPVSSSASLCEAQAPGMASKARDLENSWLNGVTLESVSMAVASDRVGAAARGMLLSCFVSLFVCLCGCAFLFVCAFIRLFVCLRCCRYCRIPAFFGYLLACLFVFICLFLNQHHAPTCTEALKALGRPVEAGPLWAKFRS